MYYNNGNSLKLFFVSLFVLVSCSSSNKKIIVNFETNIGSTIETLVLEEPEIIGEPNKLIQEQYIFAGWFLDSEYNNLFDFSSIIESNTTFHAKWIKNEFKNVITSYGSSYAIDNTNTLYSWGRNNAGQLGIGSRNDNLFPRIVKVDNLMENEYFIEIIPQSSEVFGLTNKGNLYGWGSNYKNRLGIQSSNTYEPMPVLIEIEGLSNDEKIIDFSAFNHSLALTSSGRIYSWGDNRQGQLGDGSIVDKSHPTLININLLAGETVIKIDAGQNTSFAITNLGNLYSWGSDNHYARGTEQGMQGSLRPLKVNFSILNPNEKISEISSNMYYSVAVTNQNRVITWGRNDYGQLGYRSFSNMEFKPTVIAGITNNLEVEENIIQSNASVERAFVLTNKGRIFGWGNPNNGLIGLPIIKAEEFANSRDGSATPTLIDTRNLSNDEKFINISSGWYHNLGITSRGRIFAWGKNTDGQFGTNNKSETENYFTPIKIDGI